MYRFLPYVLKTLWRHRARTLLTVSGTAAALFVFCFVGAMQQGLDALGKEGRADRTLIAFQANRFCPATSKLPEDYARTIGRLPGVNEVVPVKVYTNNCRASLDVVVFHGIPGDKLTKARQFDLVAGSMAEFERRRDAALVGRSLARRRGLEVGKPLKVGAVTVTVAGIFRSPNPADEDFAYSHLEFLQRTKTLQSVGKVTQFEILLADSADPLATAQAIDAQFRGGPVATDTRTKGVFQADTVADLAQLIDMTHYLGYACVGLVLALVSTTTIMAVHDRIREHAVLETLGFSVRRIFGLVIAESTLTSLFGGLVGVGLSLAILAFANLTVGTEGVTIAFSPTWQTAVVGMLVSVAVGILAGLVPAWRATQLDVVSALRQT
jgi:putative ABC transport system permease protein